jgi:hypothetical protein
MLLHLFALPDEKHYIMFYCFGLSCVCRVPNGTTLIHAKAFANNQLVSLIIPDTVTYIDEEAFADNPLTSVIFQGSENDIVIEENAFDSNTL